MGFLDHSVKNRKERKFSGPMILHLRKYLTQLQPSHPYPYYFIIFFSTKRLLHRISNYCFVGVKVARETKNPQGIGRVFLGTRIREIVYSVTKFKQEFITKLSKIAWIKVSIKTQSAKLL